jgi:hypothetical protein
MQSAKAKINKTSYSGHGVYRLNSEYKSGHFGKIDNK